MAMGWIHFVFKRLGFVAGVVFCGSFFFQSGSLLFKMVQCGSFFFQPGGQILSLVLPTSPYLASTSSGFLYILESLGFE